MARQKGILHLKGKIGNTTSYNLNGKLITRQIGAVNKDHFENHPNFRTVRMNNKEFGGAASMGKVLRLAFFKFQNSKKNNWFKNKLTSILKLCISEGEGIKGQRTFLWQDAKPYFEDLSFRENEFLLSFLNTLPEIQYSTSINQGTITWNSEKLFNLKSLPKSANNCLPEISLIPISNFIFNENLGKYLEEHEISLSSYKHIAFPSINLKTNSVDFSTPFSFDIPSETLHSCGIFVILNLNFQDTGNTLLQPHTFILKIITSDSNT